MKSGESFDKALASAQKGALFLAVPSLLSFIGAFLSLWLPEALLSASGLVLFLHDLLPAYEPYLSIILALLLSGGGLFLTARMAKMKRRAVFLGPSLLLLDSLLYFLYPPFSADYAGLGMGYFLAGVALKALFLLGGVIFLVLYAKLFRLNKKRIQDERASG